MEDRRTSFRTRVRWPVTITTSQGDREGETKDISGRGAFIYCEKPLNENEGCLLMKKLPNDHVAEIDAEVVWSTPPGTDDESKPQGMGVKFLW